MKHPHTGVRKKKRHCVNSTSSHISKVLITVIEKLVIS